MSERLTTDVRRQLIWNRLLAIVEEQAQTLMRTAFSTVVREAGDLSAGVFNTRGDMLAQAVTGTPGHVNAMAASLKHFIARFPVDTMQKGDVFVTNDPWLATGHLNDFTVVTPVFHDSGVVALFASTSHIADVGGRGFGPDANEVYEEGLNIPISYLFKGGESNATLMELIAANVRDSVVAEGDLHSLTACNYTGAALLIEALKEFDVDDLNHVGDAILDSSRSAMRDEIRALPNGRYTNQMVVDGYDQPITVNCALVIEDDHIHIDFAGTSRPSSYGINVPLTYAEAYASFGVRCLVGNDIPNNAGSLGTITVTAPANSILNAQPPCAVSARHALGQMLPDVVMGCLGQILDGVVPAEGASCIWNPVIMSSTDHDSNAPRARFVINPIFNGGTGARPQKDGLSTTAFPSGVRTTSTEVNELTAPLIFKRREFLPDSGGPGKFRGGLGQVIEIEHAHGSEFVISKMFDRIDHPARGKDGGDAGAKGEIYVEDGEVFRGKGKEVIAAGKTLVMKTPGGGGYGSPSNRDSSSIRSDLEAGLITGRAASSRYGFDRSGD